MSLPDWRKGLSLLLVSLPAAAQTYPLDWDAAGTGGGASGSADGRYFLVDTLGQPDASAATNDVFRLEAGLIPGLGTPPIPSAVPTAR